MMYDDLSSLRLCTLWRWLCAWWEVHAVWHMEISVLWLDVQGIGEQHGRATCLTWPALGTGIPVLHALADTSCRLGLASMWIMSCVFVKPHGRQRDAVLYYTWYWCVWTEG